MKRNIVLILTAIMAAATSCTQKEEQSPIIGTWELISATTVEKDTSFSTFDPTHRMIKIINPTHFAFLNHALDRSKDSSATAFSAGGGNYTLADSTYTEHLEYFNDKEWENHDFTFVVKIAGDTLIQKGVEKIENLGIDRVIIEKYKKVK